MHFLAKLMFGLMLASVCLADEHKHGPNCNHDHDHHGHDHHDHKGEKLAGDKKAAPLPENKDPSPPTLEVDAENKDPTQVHLKFDTKQKDGWKLMVWRDNPECSIRVYNVDNMELETISVPVKCSQKEIIINMEDGDAPKTPTTLPVGRYNAKIVVLKKKGGDVLSESKFTEFTLGAKLAVEPDSASYTAKPGMLTLVIGVATIVFLSL
eukprot:2942_1